MVIAGCNTEIIFRFLAALNAFSEKPYLPTITISASLTLDMNSSMEDGILQNSEISKNLKSFPVFFW